MCFLAPVLAPEQAGAVAETDQGKIIPDMGAWADWFNQADERRRKLAVGARRYAEVEAKMGRQPVLADFVDEAGLLSR